MIKEFLKPASVEEAVSLKEKSGARACYFGGGSQLNRSQHDFEVAISLEALSLNGIKDEQGEWRIGSYVTLQELMDTPALPEPLRVAATHMASRNMRNLATVGGDIASNTIDSALIPYLIASNAVLVTAEEGDVSVETYLFDHKTSLILEVKLPKTGRQVAVKKVAIQTHAVPVISVAVGASITKGQVSDAVIAVSGTTEGVSRLNSVETAWMQGKDGLEKAVTEAVQFKSDLQGSSEYKTYVSGVTIADLIDELK